MIQTEYLQDGRLIRHRSDSGMMIRQVETGAEYSDAVDVVPCRYAYVETDMPVPDEAEATEGDYKAALAELGVSVDA